MSSSAGQADQPNSSAPGKILIAGEYVVLDGAPAIVMAVDRRAHGYIAEDAQDLSPFLQAVVDLVEPEEAKRIVVDTSELRNEDGVKLGLGSSAAATVIATALSLETADRPLIHDIAHRAHQMAQEPRGSKGSGADVAAAVHGGVLIVQQQEDDEDAPLKFQRTFMPPDLIFIPVWTGNPADTPTLVAQVRALRAERPDEYAAAAARIAGASTRIIEAFGKTGNAERVVEALGSGGEAIEALGQAAGAALWTKAHARIRGLIESLGATVKPTGAGGGDIALVALADPEAEAEVRQRLKRAGIEVLDLSVDRNGVLL